MLAPSMSPTDCDKFSNDVLTKLTIITVDADEDCIRAVIRKPPTTPSKGFETR